MAREKQSPSNKKQDSTKTVHATAPTLDNSAEQQDTTPAENKNEDKDHKPNNVNDKIEQESIVTKISEDHKREYRVSANPYLVAGQKVVSLYEERHPCQLSDLKLVKKNCSRSK